MIQISTRLVTPVEPSRVADIKVTHKFRTIRLNVKI